MSYGMPPGLLVYLLAMSGFVQVDHKQRVDNCLATTSKMLTVCCTLPVCGRRKINGVDFMKKKKKTFTKHKI